MGLWRWILLSHPPRRTQQINSNSNSVCSAQMEARYPAYKMLRWPIPQRRPKAASVSTGNPALWNTLLNVPGMFANGLSRWRRSVVQSHLNFDGVGLLDDYTGACEPRVRAAVDGVFDWVYDGHGNWPFNTAYAASQGYEGYVARFTSLDKAEQYIAAGVPVIMSIAWGNGDLTGSDIDSTNGHLFVLVGFDACRQPDCQRSRLAY